MICFHIGNGLCQRFIPCGRVMQAPSTIAWASSRSLHSRARAAALSASQISFRPSKAGAVSQNSSLLLLSWPSVIGYSLFHLGRSFLRGSLRAIKEELQKDCCFYLQMACNLQCFFWRVYVKDQQRVWVAKWKQKWKHIFQNPKRCLRDISIQHSFLQYP